ncbi:MAG TPA: twin-arginine translocase TatA/TatE family subunit [Holophaga sp.]|jgi:TatA/E family protein of Tat protein translocase|nr:twin-arginine translocase TatA/TatE family subunit [Holophaga sp.]
MANLGLTEILLIGLLLLVFFGPQKLPELGKALGKGIQEFKKASRELTDAVKEDGKRESGEHK